MDLDLAAGPGLMVAKGRPAPGKVCSRSVIGFLKEPPLVALEVAMYAGSRGALETSAV